MSDVGSDVDIHEQIPSIGTYEGERTATGERHGKGRNTYPNNDVYEGEYVNGNKKGFGIYTWKKPKARYVGQYVNNVRQGFGTMAYPNGSRYQGDWNLGKRHGKGIYVYPNGDTYQGEWVNDYKHGLGIYTFIKTNSQISGTWDQNYLLGSTIITHADHSIHGNYIHIKDNVPNNPDDDTQGTKEIIRGSILQRPCTIHYNTTDYDVPNHWISEQLGLGSGSGVITAGGHDNNKQ